MTGDWILERHHGAAGRLHDMDPPSPPQRRVWVMTTDRPSLVLGSTQRGGALERALSVSGRDLAVRRSGGGVVLLDPRSDLWVDVLLPRSDPLWTDDVATSARWLGAVWVAALRRCGVTAELYGGPTWRDELARTACFAGLAPGEVLVGGRKVVGISQRRSRDGARFQCVVNGHAGDLADLIGDPDLSERLQELAGTAGADLDELLQAFLDSLP